MSIKNELKVTFEEGQKRKVMLMNNVSEESESEAEYIAKEGLKLFEHGDR